MTDPDIRQTISEVDQNIENYIERCRQRIPAFVDTHFSLKETWALQKPTFWLDLVAGIANSLWALAYLTVKKVADTVEKLGNPVLTEFCQKLPSGVKTGYQRKIDTLIREELLELKGTEFSDAKLSKYFARDKTTSDKIGKMLEQFSASRALVSDLSGTAITLFFGWYFFGNSSMSLDSMARGFARRRAHDEAASNFFLGKDIGNTFYDIFPPEVRKESVRMYLFLLGAGLTFGAMAFTIFSDPLRKLVGLHRVRLNVLLSELEKELLVLSHKHVKKALGTSTTVEVYGEKHP